MEVEFSSKGKIIWLILLLLLMKLLLELLLVQILLDLLLELLLLLILSCTITNVVIATTAVIIISSVSILHYSYYAYP
jgi:hypothetical protein